MKKLKKNHEMEVILNTLQKIDKQQKTEKLKIERQLKKLNSQLTTLRTQAKQKKERDQRSGFLPSVEQAIIQASTISDKQIDYLNKKVDHLVDRNAKLKKKVAKQKNCPNWGKIPNICIDSLKESLEVKNQQLEQKDEVIKMYQQQVQQMKEIIHLKDQEITRILKEKQLMLDENQRDITILTPKVNSKTGKNNLYSYTEDSLESNDPTNIFSSCEKISSAKYQSTIGPLKTWNSTAQKAERKKMSRALSTESYKHYLNKYRMSSISRISHTRGKKDIKSPKKNQAMTDSKLQQKRPNQESSLFNKSCEKSAFLFTIGLDDGEDSMLAPFNASNVQSARNLHRNRRHKLSNQLKKSFDVPLKMWPSNQDYKKDDEFEVLVNKIQRCSEQLDECQRELKNLSSNQEVQRQVLLNKEKAYEARLSILNHKLNSVRQCDQSSSSSLPKNHFIKIQPKVLKETTTGEPNYLLIIDPIGIPSDSDSEKKAFRKKSSRQKSWYGKDLNYWLIDMFPCYDHGSIKSSFEVDIDRTNVQKTEQKPKKKAKAIARHSKIKHLEISFEDDAKEKSGYGSQKSIKSLKQKA